MSLSSYMDDKLTRDRFKAIAPEAAMFRLAPGSAAPGTPPFANCPLLVPADPFASGRAGRIGMAFDYLLRAHVARWRALPAEASMRWVATKGLGSVAGIGEGVPYDLDGPTELGSMCLAFLEEFGDTTPSCRVFRRYHVACGAWRDFVEGREPLTRQLLQACWILAGLERLSRGGWATEIDPDDVAAEADAEDLGSLQELCRVFVEHKQLFDLGDASVLNPSFGDASDMLAGADADLVLGTALIEIKATANRGYAWRDAAQMASYVVLAAMHGSPWPLHRAGIYQARFGRLVWVDVAELAAAKDLLGFGTWLATLGNRSNQATRTRLVENLHANLGALASTAVTPLPPVPAGPKVVALQGDLDWAAETNGRPGAADAWVLAVLQEFADSEVTVDDLYDWQGDDEALSRHAIGAALDRLFRSAAVVRDVDLQDGRTRWALRI